MRRGWGEREVVTDGALGKVDVGAAVVVGFWGYVPAGGVSGEGKMGGVVLARGKAVRK